MKDKPFSRRHGFRSEESGISIRNDAPVEVREAILRIAEGEMDVAPSLLREVLCTVLRKVPNRNNWTPYPNIWGECQELIENAPWYRVYDFVEALYQEIEEKWELETAEEWAELINEYFLEAGVGWRVVDGKLESRGAEGFETSVDAARYALGSAGLRTAQQEIHEALRDLSRRPDPDLTGAVHHAMAALECTAREVTDDVRATLGEIIQHNPDLFPKPIDTALHKMWGYASETGRHIREGRTPGRAEAELVVGVAASVSTYLVSQVGRI